MDLSRDEVLLRLIHLAAILFIFHLLRIHFPWRGRDDRLAGKLHSSLQTHALQAW